MTGGFSWNLLSDIRTMWTFPFMVNAFRAGAIVAVIAGAMGWFMVLRRQAFAGHTLSMAAFPGAAGATVIGISAAYGYFGFCIGAATVIALATAGASPAGSNPAGSRFARSRSGRSESALTGIVQAFTLACGLEFVALYKGFLNGTTTLLFGSFLGITAGQVVTLAAVGLVVLAVLAVAGRPLLFASVDPGAAAARGVPVRALAIVFLVLLGAAVAETAQITGALLVFALLVMPAATAQRLTPRPLASLIITIMIGWLVTWAGLTAAFYSPYPIGFYVTTFAFAAYLTAHVVAAVGPRGRRRGLQRPGRTRPTAEVAA